MRFRSAALVLSLTTALVLALGISACGGAKVPPPAAAQAPVPKPKNAQQIADRLVDGKVGTMLYVDRMRGRPAALKLVQAGYLGDLLDGTGVDLLRDFERIYVASTGIQRDDRAAIVAQHKLTETRLRAAVDALIARSDPAGAWLDDTGVPAARVTIHGHTRIVALIDTEYLVVVPESLSKQVASFAGTGGFPDPEGQESAITVAHEPSESLRAPRIPRIPDTVKTARITLRFGDDGSAELAATGESASDQQAIADAAAMTEAVDRATSMRISILRVRFFKPVLFRAEGALVKSEVHLAPEEIDKLLGMAELARRHMQ